MNGRVTRKAEPDVIMEGTSMNKWTIWGAVAIVGLSSLAVIAARNYPVQVASSPSLPFPVSSSLDEASTLLPDGQKLALRDGVLILNGKTQALPLHRRFASLTTMPSGQVLIWGGVGDDGRLLETGEWFEPATMATVTTGRLGLPARAGHAINVLSDGTLAMTGGWGEGNVAAHDIALWRPIDRRLTLRRGDVDHVRFKPSTELMANGELNVRGGVDELGRTVPGEWRFVPSPLGAAAKSHGISASYPANDTTDASPVGPLALRFVDPVDVTGLQDAVSLLGPNGVVKTRIVGAEGGRLAFVQLPDELYPAARYTLFVKNLRTASGATVPYEAIGFTTRPARNGVVLSGEGHRPSASEATTDSAPIFVMAGGGAVKPCRPSDAFHLCRDKGAVLDGAFYPGQDNVATSSGGHWRLYRDRQSLPDVRSHEANIPKGATALIGQVRRIDERPVANVEIVVDGKKVRTDAQGVFVLRDLQPGRLEIFVDGRTASGGDVEYGRFLVGADIEAAKVNRMPFIMYLPRVLERDKVALPSPTTRETVLTHPDMPGLELRIPAGAVFKDRDGKVLSEIAIVPTPVDHAPFPLPDNFPMYFTIQPGDAVVQGMTPEAARGIQVVYPNYGKQKPADRADFWVYSADKGWEMYGAGHVSDDASQLVADKDTRLVWALGAGASTNPSEPDNDKKPDNKCDGDPVDLQTGIYYANHVDMFVKDIIPLVLDRSNNGIFNPVSAFGAGSGTSLSMTLSSSDGFQSPKIVLSCGEAIRFRLVSGQPSWPLVGTVWKHSESKSRFYGATLQFLNDSTPEGAHWVVTLADGSQYWFDRHAPNKLVRHADRFGNASRYTYEGGLLVQVTSPSGRSMFIEYNNYNFIKSVSDNSGRKVFYDYAKLAGVEGSVEMRALTKVTYPDGTSEKYSYLSVKNGGIDFQLPLISSVTDRRGIVQVKNSFDPLLVGVVSRQDFPDGSSNSFSYERSGGVVKAVEVTDGNGHKERTEFDVVSHYPSRSVRGYGSPIAMETRFERSASGQLMSYTDAIGRKTTYEYDDAGNQVSVKRGAESGEGYIVRRAYTAENLVSSVTDVLGRTARKSYENGCISAEVDVDGSVTSYSCDASGRIESVTSPDGAVTRFRYSGGDLIESINAMGGVTRYAYDSLGRMTSSSDAHGAVSTFAYDSNDRMTEYVDPMGAKTKVVYDGNGNVINVDLPNGASLSYEYDSMNRLITREDALGKVERRTYDHVGNVLTNQDRNGHLVTFNYDDLDRPLLITYPDGSGIQATYDGVGRMLSILDSVSGQIAWEYDANDNVTAESTSNGVVRYAYDELGRRIALRLNAGPSVSYEYDVAGNVKRIAYDNGNYDFTYDIGGYRKALRFPNGMVASYERDRRGRLVGLDYAAGDGSKLWTASYGYDEVGKRIFSGSGEAGSYDLLDKTSDSDSMVDVSNQLISAQGHAFSYDKNGNMLSDGVRNYIWDVRNRLVSVREGGVEILGYVYDALDRRVEKRHDGKTTSYVYDGVSVLSRKDASGEKRFVDGPVIDEHLAVDDGERRYFVSDGLRSTVAMTSGSATTVARFRYTPFGSGTDDLSMAADLGFGGREKDLQDFYYNRARYYRPDLGRFMSEDPVGFSGGGPNFHGYVNDDPISSIDPLGLRPLTDCEKAILAPYIPRIDLDNADLRDGETHGPTPKSANAITYYNTIHMREKVFAHGYPWGFSLLAHELVHVGQYRNGMTKFKYVMNYLKNGYENNKYELEASQMDERVYSDLQRRKDFCDCDSKGAR